MNRLLKTAFTCVFCVLIWADVSAQKIATLEVNTANTASGIDIPVNVNLDAITFLPDSVINLIEITGNKRTPIPYQLDNRGTRFLYWLIKQNNSGAKKRVFELVHETRLASTQKVSVEAKDGFLTISANNNNLLRYNYKTIYPPAGVDTVFKRSGFIHPLWAPHGQELTRVSPWDHRHHFGLWNPWTHVLFEGDTVDFWNLAKKEGTVRFSKFVSINEGPVFGDYQALHQHVVFKKGGGEKIAMDELQSVRIYQPQKNQDYYIFDITIQLNTATDSPVLLMKYTYGSLGWRATEKWTRDNSEVLTSEGKTRKDADGSTARWCMVQGQIDNDYAGAVMMSYPTNYNYPEPLRVWPQNVAIGKGDVYANFSPTKDKDWLLEKGKNYVLKYRFIVYNGHFNKDKAEAAWQNFVHPPSVNIKLNK